MIDVRVQRFGSPAERIGEPTRTLWHETHANALQILGAEAPSGGADVRQCRLERRDFTDPFTFPLGG
jgi:hypothetical protein